MKDVVLLSEIHPLAMQNINPLGQAQIWFGLLTNEDIVRLQARRTIGFLDAIGLIHQRCSERNSTLIIRDWSQVDFTGWPHFGNPAYRLTTAEQLRKRFSVVHTMTVRHPIDQWISFIKSQSWTGQSMPLTEFLYGYLKFAEYCNQIGFVRYEDFVIDPDRALREICGYLQVTYDPSYRDRWQAYTTITSFQGERDFVNNIRPQPRPPVEPGVLRQIEKNSDYQQAIRLLGYKHPS